MPQRRLADFDYSDPDVAFFVTIRAHPGKAPFTDARLAGQVVSSLEWLRANRGVKIYAYCLMPDHLHLLIRLGDTGHELGQIIGSLKSFTTKQCWKLGFRGILWQDHFHDHVLRCNEDASSIATYILENPVRKGLVESAELYEWSGTPDPM